MEGWREVLLMAVKHKCESKEWNKTKIAIGAGIHVRQLQRYLVGDRIPTVEVFFRIIILCDFQATFEIPNEKFVI